MNDVGSTQQQVESRSIYICLEKSTTPLLRIYKETKDAYLFGYQKNGPNKKAQGKSYITTICSRVIFPLLLLLLFFNNLKGLNCIQVGQTTECREERLDSVIVTDM